MRKLALVTSCLAIANVGSSKASNGYASYFGPGLYGNSTACGQILTSSLRGVAHRTLPCGTLVKVCRLYRCIVTTVVDHGPWVYGRDLDLTTATAHDLCQCWGGWGVRFVSWSVR